MAKVNDNMFRIVVGHGGLYSNFENILITIDLLQL